MENGSDETVKALILETRIKGERLLAITRLILLIPIVIMVISITIPNLSTQSFMEMIAEGVYPVQYFVIIFAAVVSFFMLRKLKKNKYSSWMPVVLPLCDVILISVSLFSFSQGTGVGLTFTSAVVWFYFLFLALSVLRSSPMSVVLTGVYSIVGYCLLCYRGYLELGVIDGDMLFKNSGGMIIGFSWDDEIIKVVVLGLLTAVLSFVAHRSNKMIKDQVDATIKSIDMRAVLDKSVRELNKKLASETRELSSDSESSVIGVRAMAKASLEIARATAGEVSAIEQSSATIAQMLRSNESISNSIEAQADLMQASASAITEMDASIKMIASNARNAEQVSGELLHAAEEGEETVREATQGIQETREATLRIEEIIGIISAVAESTNLLAMNAAIEAAHAGDAGKGFAVVADEIRRLAEDTAENSNLISGIVQEIAERVSKVVAQSEAADQSLKSILGDAKQSAKINQEILAAMEEQALTMTEILGSVQKLEGIAVEVKRASEEQNLGSGEILSAIESLKELAGRVRELTDAQAAQAVEVEKTVDSLKEGISRNAKSTESLNKLVNEL